MKKEEVCVFIDKSNYHEVMDVLKKHGETLCTGTDIEVSGMHRNIPPGYNWIQLDEYGAWWVGKESNNNAGETITKITLEQLDNILSVGEPIMELTVKEIAMKLGIDVRYLRIKH